MTHPYRAFEDTPEWRTIDAALRDLETNRDVAITTARPYVVGYLVRALRLALGSAPEVSGGGGGPVRFTGDDYQLVADASYREEDRRELFERLHGVPAPPDDQLDRLADLGRRLGSYLREQDTEPGESSAAT